MGKPKQRAHPLAVIREAKRFGINEVLLSYSGGKDSAACLDLCAKHFDRVVPFFMYVVKGLSFQEVYLRHIERRYDVEILRLPHWQLGQIINSSSFMHHSAANKKAPRSVSGRDVEMKLRKETGLTWVVSGETTDESLQRNGMIKSCNSICTKRGHIYAIGHWRRKDVEGYLSDNDIPLPPEYSVTLDKRSFGGLRMEQIAPIKERFPSDYEKIKRQFPLVDAQVARWNAEHRE